MKEWVKRLFCTYILTFKTQKQKKPHQMAEPKISQKIAEEKVRNILLNVNFRLPKKKSDTE